MRVALHAGQLLQRVPGGIGRYVHNLIRHLPAVSAEPVLFAAGPRPVDLAFTHEWHDLGPPRGATRYELWHRLRRPRVAVDAAVLHAPSAAIPPPSGVPLVATVHDVAFLRFPDTFTRRGRSFHERGLELARREAFVVAPSIFTQRELVAEGFDPQRIAVIPHGADRVAPRSEQETNWRLARARVERPYVLIVGTVEPRKNHATLIDAMRIVRRDHPDLRLVVAGPLGWGAPPPMDESWILHLGSVSDETLDACYRGAVLACQPSRYEGFGLPALEAMTRSCPIVASAGGALEEVVGHAGRLVDPDDIAALASAIGSITSDLAARDALVAAGLERAAEFSWVASAEAHVDLYRRAIGEAGTA